MNSPNAASCLRVEARFAAFVLLVGLLLGTISCASQSGHARRTQADTTTLMTARSGGDVVLEWQSRPDKLYTVLYSPALGPKAKWRPLPGNIKIHGTGGLIRRTDTVHPGTQRYYRLLIEPAARR